MKRSKRNTVAIDLKRGNVFLLTPLSAKVIETLRKETLVGYDRLAKKTGISKDSLYVYGHRLERSGLAFRTPVMCRDGRIRTHLTPAKNIVIKKTFNLG